MRYLYAFKMKCGCIGYADDVAKNKKEMEQKIHRFYRSEPEDEYCLDKILSIRRFTKKHKQKVKRILAEFEADPCF